MSKGQYIICALLGVAHTLSIFGSITLPQRSSLVRALLLIQPSSASAERAFSLLTNVFGSQRGSALHYMYNEVSVMYFYFLYALV